MTSILATHLRDVWSYDGLEVVAISGSMVSASIGPTFPISEFCMDVCDPVSFDASVDVVYTSTGTKLEITRGVRQSPEAKLVAGCGTCGWCSRCLPRGSINRSGSGPRVISITRRLSCSPLISKGTPIWWLVGSKALVATALARPSTITWIYTSPPTRLLLPVAIPKHRIGGFGGGSPCWFWYVTTGAATRARFESVVFTTRVIASLLGWLVPTNSGRRAPSSVSVAATASVVTSAPRGRWSPKLSTNGIQIEVAASSDTVNVGAAMIERGSVIAATTVAFSVGLAALENIPVAGVGGAALVYVVAAGWESVLGRAVNLVSIATLLATHTANPSHFTAPIALALLYI